MEKISFKLTAGSSISSQDIYSIFAISLLLGENISPEETRLVQFESQVIRDKFVNTFIVLMRNQIKKYLSRRDRYDPNQMLFLNSYANADAATLSKMFNTATFRSERHRTEYPDEVYNIQWGEIAESVNKLSRSNSTKDIVMNLAGQAGLLNLVHNTGTLVLDKLPDAGYLLSALNECHSSNPSVVISKSNPDVRNIMSQYREAR